MSRRTELTAAARLYRDFREEAPRRARRVAVPKVPRALAVMGPCEFIGYVTTHGGKTSVYLHEFAPGSRPLMAAGSKRNQLYLVGGRYRVTAHGIVDLDARGRPVRARHRYKVVDLDARK